MNRRENTNEEIKNEHTHTHKMNGKEKTTRNNTENFNAVGLKVFAALRLKNSAHTRVKKKEKSFGHKFKKIELNAITLQFFLFLFLLLNSSIQLLSRNTLSLSLSRSLPYRPVSFSSDPSTRLLAEWLREASFHL